MKQLGDIADLIGANLIGDSEIYLSDARTIRGATHEHLTFASTEQNLQLFLDSDAPAAIISEELIPDEIALSLEKSFLRVKDVEKSFVEVIKVFRTEYQRERIGISSDAIISDSAEIAEDVDIYAGAVIGDNVKIGCGCVIHSNVNVMDNVEIGSGTVLFPGVTVYENCCIGSRCILHAGCVIGAYGFGYRSGTKHQLSEQLGNVLIEDDVEIGSNSTVDRGTFDSTRIGVGTKIDNLVMIGHNCHIGKHNLLCAQVGIAGSSTTGDYVVMAGQVGIGDHLEIGDQATIAAQAGVMHNLAGGKTYLGSPAIPAREQMQLHAIISKLPELRKQIRVMQKQVDKLNSMQEELSESEVSRDAA